MTFAAAVVCMVLAQAPVDAGAPDDVEGFVALPVVEPTADAGALALPPLVVESAELADAGAGDAPLAPEPEAPPAPSDEPVSTRVTLNDGQVLVGTVIEDTPYSLTLRIGSGDEILLPRAAVKDVSAEERAYRTKTGSTWFEDANRTRYFYGPSAMMLKKGEISFSQYELLISSIQYGVTDNISLQAGGAVPMWFIPPLPQGFNLLGAVKVGFSATELTHFAVGAQALVIPAATSSGSGGVPLLGIVFGTVTYGQRDAHASLSLGMPFAGFANPPVGPVVVSLSGNYRVSETVALVSENWFVTNINAGMGGRSTVVGIDGLMARIMGERMAADLGAVVIWEPSMGMVFPIPIPWLAFTYNFL